MEDFTARVSQNTLRFEDFNDPRSTSKGTGSIEEINDNNDDPDSVSFSI